MSENDSQNNLEMKHLMNMSMDINLNKNEIMKDFILYILQRINKHGYFDVKSKPKHYQRFIYKKSLMMLLKEFQIIYEISEQEEDFDMIITVVPDDIHIPDNNNEIINIDSSILIDIFTVLDNITSEVNFETVNNIPLYYIILKEYDESEKSNNDVLSVNVINISNIQEVNKDILYFSNKFEAISVANCLLKYDYIKCFENL